ncbi:MAG TPA: SDR family NAD(P)-dependent oxidoreductase [Paracoccus sp. (in: a-proteobacteria)]|nr:SDR family NAD(P)-dependent oxidoreductase [Paracoccus sp. (in: a-proteobacteria)]
MRTVLITGCSSGIGLDAALHMQARGWKVIATCRAPADIAARQAEGMICLPLELADPDSTARCAEAALTHGPIDALVNNAAFALPGAVEDLPREGLRAIFEANLFGTHDLTRRLIPHFRTRGAGRIVNISSILGLVGVPWRGAYVATKFALEGLTDVLRIEMADTPVKVVLIEPGPITSRIRANSIPHFKRWIDWQSSARAEQYRASLLRRLYEPSGPDRFELLPAAVSEKLVHALESPNPRVRYAVTQPTRMVAVGRRLLPTRALDWFARRS